MLTLDFFLIATLAAPLLGWTVGGVSSSDSGENIIIFHNQWSQQTSSAHQRKEVREVVQMMICLPTDSPPLTHCHCLRLPQGVW